MREILQLFELVPHNLWVIIGALLCSHAGTQWLKFYLPKDSSEMVKTHGPRVLAFAFAAAPTAVMWDGPMHVAAFAGFCVGLWAPTVWMVGMRVLGVFAPRLREALSVDSTKPQEPQP